jgi:hypothetical protein
MQSLADELALIEAVLKGYPASIAQSDALRAVQRVATLTTLPRADTAEASAMLDTILAEYNYPANTKNAARAGYEAARRHLARE